MEVSAESGGSIWLHWQMRTGSWQGERKTMDATWTVPKNIRQIGEAHAHYAVYIEDYVSTYIKQVVRLSDGGIRQGALVGNVYPEGEKTVFVIQGIVTDKELYRTGSQLFSPQGKEELRKQCGRYFGELDVIGGVIFEPGREEMDAIRRNMLAENGSMGQIFLHVDCSDGAQEFAIGSQGAVELIESYYIYYERNEAMQNYLIAYNEETRRKVEEVHDIISGQARAAMGEIRMPRARMQKDTLLICATCALLICVTLLGIININQYQKMCKMEASFHTVMVRLGLDDDDAVPAGTDDAYTDISGNGAGEIVVSDITPEDGLASGEEQDGLFDGLPIYVSGSESGDGDLVGENASGESAQITDGNGSGEPAQNVDGNASAESAQNVEGNANGEPGQYADGNANGEPVQNADGNGIGESAQNVGGNAGGELGQEADSGEGTQTVGGDGSFGADTQADGNNSSGLGTGSAGTGSDGNQAQNREAEEYAGADDGDAQQDGEGVLAAGAAGENGSAGYREYTIRKGDTLTSISMLFYQNRGMIRQICELNGIENADNIVAGQKILLP